jgi:ABC-type dipeptide/oligopeptide/nickel transport system permease component
MTAILRYVGKRLAISVITLWGVTIIAFSLVQLLPGDPARTIAGLLASSAEVERIRERMGLEAPLPVQYGVYVSRLVQGDLGVSARTRRPVRSEIAARLPRTLQLAAVATVIGTVGGILAGVAAARRRGRWPDHVISTVSVMGVAMPVYWLGLLLILLFAVRLGWLPAAGADRVSSIVLPGLTLGVFSVALIARMTRASMLDVLQQDYVRTAYAKGVRDRVAVYRHALRNAFIPILTVIGLQFGALLGGAVLTENVFGWPGIGRLLVDSIFARDFPMVQGIVLVYAVLFILVNLAVDVLYAYVNPRIQY